MAVKKSVVELLKFAMALEVAFGVVGLFWALALSAAVVYLLTYLFGPIGGAVFAAFSAAYIAIWVLHSLLRVQGNKEAGAGEALHGHTLVKGGAYSRYCVCPLGKSAIRRLQRLPRPGPVPIRKRAGKILRLAPPDPHQPQTPPLGPQHAAGGTPGIAFSPRRCRRELLSGRSAVLTRVKPASSLHARLTMWRRLRLSHLGEHDKTYNM